MREGAVRNGITARTGSGRPSFGAARSHSPFRGAFHDDCRPQWIDSLSLSNQRGKVGRQLAVKQAVKTKNLYLSLSLEGEVVEREEIKSLNMR